MPQEDFWDDARDAAGDAPTEGRSTPAAESRLGTAT